VEKVYILFIQKWMIGTGTENNDTNLGSDQLNLLKLLKNTENKGEYSLLISPFYP